MSSKPNLGSRGISTRCVHVGEIHWKRSLTTPITQTSTFIFENMQEVQDYTSGIVKHYEYGRYGNPTRQAAEEKLADLEGGEACTVLDSGMRAVAVAIETFVSSGDHVIFTDDAYKKTLQFANEQLPRFNVKTTIVPMGDYKAMERAVRPNTKVIVTESPTNPYLNIADLGEVVRIAKKCGALSMIDSTFGCPINQRPLEYGIDLIIHSVTKYLGGHNDILGGAIIGSAALLEQVRAYQGTVGGILDPNSCYLLIRGLKTLALRVKWQNESAQLVAEFLEGHPKVKRVYYPGLPSHQNYELAQRYMYGYGGVVTFDLAVDLAKTLRFCDFLEICQIGPSLGGPESLITHPATVTYYKLTREERLKIGITDTLLRLAVGFENPEDLIADLEQALDKM